MKDYNLLKQKLAIIASSSVLSDSVVSAIDDASALLEEYHDRLSEADEKKLAVSPEMAKIISGLETCASNDKTCFDCPYNKEVCTTSLCNEVLALLNEQEEEIENLKQTAQSMMEGVCLLKKQEAVKPVRDKETGRIWLCGNCGTYVGFEDHDENDPNEFDKYCRECGHPVLWKGR